MQVIAEVKIKSPFGFQSTYDWEELLDMALEIGDIISIHTERDFGGGFNLLEYVSNKVHGEVPILAKGRHRTIEDMDMAAVSGASYILMMDTVLNYTTDPPIEQLCEPTDIFKFNRINELPNKENIKLVWNQRNLINGTRKPESISMVRDLWGGWLCQASFIKSMDDVHPDVDAILVGEHLPRIYKELKG